MTTARLHHTIGAAAGEGPIAAGQYVYVWTFEVRPEHVAEFERAYGPEGEWVALFRRGPGYRSTRLLRDRERSGRYVTIDAWESAAAFEAFRREHAAAFESLDRRCEGLTLRETLVGRFESVG